VTGEEAVKVQLLYFPGCPHIEAARELLAQLSVRFTEVDVTASDTPAELRQWGSPTILVDGADVAGEVVGTGAACRLYPHPGGPRGVPTVEMVRGRIDRR
jgi:mercuric ion transport protein